MTTQSPEAVARFVGDQFLRTGCHTEAIDAYKEAGATDQILAIARLPPDTIDHHLVVEAFTALGQVVPTDVAKVHLLWHRAKGRWHDVIRISESHGFRIPRSVSIAAGDLCMKDDHSFPDARAHYERAKAWDRLEQWLDAALARAVRTRRRYTLDDSLLALCRTRRFKHKLSACAEALVALNELTDAAKLYVEAGQTPPSAPFVAAADQLLQRGKYHEAVWAYQAVGLTLSNERVEAAAEEAFRAEKLDVACVLYEAIKKKVPAEKREAYSDLAYKLGRYADAVSFCAVPLLPEKYAVRLQTFFEKEELGPILSQKRKSETHLFIELLRERGAPVPSEGIALYAERCFQAKMYPEAAALFLLAGVRAHEEEFLAWADKISSSKHWHLREENKDAILDAYEVAGAVDRLVAKREHERVRRLCTALGIPVPAPVPRSLHHRCAKPAPGEDPVVWADAQLAKRRTSSWDDTFLETIVDAYRSAGVADKLIALGDRLCEMGQRSSRHRAFAKKIYTIVATLTLPVP